MTRQVEVAPLLAVVRRWAQRGRWCGDAERFITDYFGIRFVWRAGNCGCPICLRSDSMRFPDVPRFTPTADSTEWLNAVDVQTVVGGRTMRLLTEPSFRDEVLALLPLIITRRDVVAKD